MRHSYAECLLLKREQGVNRRFVSCALGAGQSMALAQDLFSVVSVRSVPTPQHGQGVGKS